MATANISPTTALKLERLTKVQVQSSQRFQNNENDSKLTEKCWKSQNICQKIRPIQAQFTRTRWIRRQPEKKKKAKTKPMNSWIGFRAFYKDVFPNMPQKDASSILTILWNKDPFKVKWAIVSAAYSKIRDAVTKKCAPLNVYLGLVCPHVGIPTVEEYLEKLNWTSYTDERGLITFKQKIVPAISASSNELLSSVVTSGEVIQLCADKGYISQAIARQINSEVNDFVSFFGSKGPIQNQLPFQDSSQIECNAFECSQIYEDQSRSFAIESNSPNPAEDFDFERFILEENCAIGYPGMTDSHGHEEILDENGILQKNYSQISIYENLNT